MRVRPGVPSDTVWQALSEHAERLQQHHLAELFALDPARFATLSRRSGPLLFDFSKQRVTSETLQLLSTLADSRDLRGWIHRLFAGEKVNHTEDRAAMHWALRVPADQLSPVQDEVQQVLSNMEHIVGRLHARQWRGVTGEVITDVVNIGVGGSDLGPMMVCRALEDEVEGEAIQLHFVSSMDGSQVSHLLRRLRPQNTLFVISSKSFTTVDTLYNAGTARAWLQRALGDDPTVVGCHFVGISGNAQGMSEWGIPSENQLRLWEWVGGRFSLWSSIGFPIAVRIGMSGFRALLDGAHTMDEHFRTSPWLDNIPVLMALIGIWNTNCLNIHAQAVLPYDGRLKHLPAYLSQLEMESNGKSVTRDGEPVPTGTCPVLWGEVGPNAQHAFYQLLHQGTEPVTSDFIAPARRYHNAQHDAAAAELVAQHELALANCFAQSRLLALGEAALPADQQLPLYMRYHGNQPSSTLLLDELEPFALGALLAAYEHKVFAQAVIWQINPFDQWGVEMGKRIATETLRRIQGQAGGSTDSSTYGLIDAVAGCRQEAAAGQIISR
ncbi:MAG: glucose-6-phosphate isomerase [Alcanivoracaceae bacterium]